MIRRLTCLCLACCFYAASAFAADKAFPFSRTVHDPQIQGMAGAGFASGQGVAFGVMGTSSAGALTEEKLDVAFSYTRWNPSSDNCFNLGGMFKVGKRWHLGVAVSTGFGDPYEIVDAFGKSKGNFRPFNLSGGLGASVRITDWLGIGINARLLMQNIAENRSNTAFCGDVYAACRFGGFRAAVAAIGIGSKVTSASGVTFNLPSSAKLGLHYGADIKRHHLEINADGDWFFKSGLAASVGGTYSFAGYVTVRGGYHFGGKSVLTSYSTVGLGTAIKGFRLDACYLIASGTMKNSFCIGLGYSF